MADFCHTSVRQLADFAAPECGARLLFWKNEKTIINIVVGSFGGAGGAAKLERRSLNVNFFQIGPIVELLFHLLSFFPVCRNVPEPCRNARDVFNIRQEYSPIGKQLKILRFL